MDKTKTELQKKELAQGTMARSKEPVRRLLDKAVELRNQGQPDQALKTLNQGAFLDPGFAETYLLRAEIYRQKGQYQKALDDLTRVIELEPVNATTYIQRGEIYRQQKQPREALIDLNQAIKLEPDSSLALGRRGILYRSTNEYVEALADFELALKSDPTSTWLYGNRAETYRGLKEYSKAINDYSRVLKLNPAQSWVYERRSYCYLQLGYLDSARSDFEESWKANPNNLLHGWMAEWTQMCKKSFSLSSEVEERLKALAEVAPRQYAAYLCRASLYWLQGAFEASYKEAETAGELEPDRGEACLWKGMAAAGLKEDQAAISLLQTALSLNLPPILLCPAHWLKEINPAFYREFEQIILGKSTLTDNESDVTATREVNNPAGSLQPETKTRQAAPALTAYEIKPARTAPGETLPKAPQVESPESRHPTRTIVAQDKVISKRVGPDEPPLKGENKGAVKETQNAEQETGRLDPGLNSLAAEDRAGEIIPLPTQPLKPDFPAGKITAAADSDYHNEIKDNFSRSEKAGGAETFNLPAAGRSVAPGKNAANTRFTKGAIGILVVVGLLIVAGLFLMQANQQQEQPVNSTISQPASLPVPSATAITSSPTINSTTEQTSTVATSQITTGPASPVTTAPPRPATTAPPGPTEYPTAVLAINVSPDAGTQALMAELKNFSNRNLTGHTSYIYSVAFSPDGQLLASGSNDNTVKLWGMGRAGSVRPQASLTGHQAAVYSVAFSPDGKLLASASADNTIKLWQIVTTAAGGVTVKETATLKGHTGGVNLVNFSPDGHLLASASEDSTIKLWDVNTGQTVRTLQGHAFLVNSVAFSPDGRTLASGSNDKTIKLWEVTSGRELATLTGHTNYVNSVAFSRDGRFLASASSDRTIKLWNAITIKNVATLTGHSTEVAIVAFSPDGKILASGSADSIIKLWDVRQIDNGSNELATLQSSSVGVFSLAFSPDGQTLAAGSRSQVIKLWDFNSNVFNRNV